MTDVLTDGLPTAGQPGAPADAARLSGAADHAAGIAIGTKVEVRRRFDESWATGFEVAEAVEGGYRVRRLSDGDVLPAVFDAEAVRVERRRRNNMWWY